MAVICNVCRLEITNPTEAEKDRIYQTTKGHLLPAQKKHDACDAAYAAEKKGLTKRADLEAMPIQARLRSLGKLRAMPHPATRGQRR